MTISNIDKIKDIIKKYKIKHDIFYSKQDKQKILFVPTYSNFNYDIFLDCNSKENKKNIANLLKCLEQSILILNEYNEGFDKKTSDDVIEYIIGSVVNNEKIFFAEHEGIKISFNTRKELEQEKNIIEQRNLFYKNKLKSVKVITGDTGSGKTYHALKDTQKKNEKFCYLAPTGALVFDTYQQYRTKGDSLNALGVTINGKGNHFTTYNNNFNFDDYDTIIIDECHWCFEFNNHGYFIRQIIEKFNKKIIFITGTVNFKVLPDWEFTNLKPKKKFTKNKISLDDSIQRMKDGIPTIIIGQSFNDCNSFISNYLQETIYTEDSCITKNLYDYDFVSRDSNPLQILKSLINFNKGQNKILVGTNILAQGINLSCENLIVLDYNHWSVDNATLNNQRVGRLGRLNLTADNAFLTWGSDAHLNLTLERTNDFFNLPKKFINEYYEDKRMTEAELSEFIKLIFEN